MWIWLCRGKFKLRIAHFQLLSPSQKRARLCSLLWPSHDRRWYDRGLRYSHSRRNLENHGNNWLPEQEWWSVSWTIVKLSKPSHWPTESSMVLSWPRRCSAWCFQPCCLTVTELESLSLAFTSGTGPMEGCSIPGGCRLSRRWGRLFSETFFFADDCALNASREQEMQADMDSFSSVCDNFSLTINTNKTEGMLQPAPGNQ